VKVLSVLLLLVVSLWISASEAHAGWRARRAARTSTRSGYSVRVASGSYSAGMTRAKSGASACSSGTCGS
jgi:hypothetical protein